MIDEIEVVTPKLVVIESPFRGPEGPNAWKETRRNLLYARLCVNDCLRRGEAPYASHLFFTQTGILDDSDEDQRIRGINAGVAWGSQATLTAVYEDFGISSGMEYGIEAAIRAERPIEHRKLAGIINLEAALIRLDQAKQYIDVGRLLF